MNIYAALKESQFGFLLTLFENEFDDIIKTLVGVILSAYLVDKDYNNAVIAGIMIITSILVGSSQMRKQAQRFVEANMPTIQAGIEKVLHQKFIFNLNGQSITIDIPDDFEGEIAKFVSDKIKEFVD